MNRLSIHLKGEKKRKKCAEERRTPNGKIHKKWIDKI
jgi:hypothetical protein